MLSRRFFCLQLDWPITKGGLISGSLRYLFREFRIPRYVQFVSTCTELRHDNKTGAYLQLLQSKASSSPYLGVVFEGWTADNGPKSTSHRSGSNLKSPLLTSNTPALLTSRLIKPCPHIVLPLFVEVVVVYHIVVFWSHGGKVVVLNLQVT